MGNVVKKLLSTVNKDTDQLPYNFGAGPAMLPREVMQQAREEFVNWHDRGMSVMEMSHRSREFMSIAEQSEADLRELLQIPEQYKVLFLQGGATSQFAMVPLNLLQDKNSVDYLVTGHWSARAATEAQRHTCVNIALDTGHTNYRSLPLTAMQLDPAAAYVYYTDNETINGVEFPNPPATGDVPLVTDMTSNLLSRPLDISQFGIIFAGAQKNLGPSGLVVVIIREDLVGHASKHCPTLYDYSIHVTHECMYNTPATFSWYITGLVLQWVRQQGGVAVMDRNAQEKSSRLYQFIDQNDFYHNHVDKDCRSRMNVPFVLADVSLETMFVSQAEENGLLGLAGHRSVGGIRASIYNAMPVEAVEQLIAFMSEFARRHG